MKIAFIILTALVILIGLWDAAIVRGGSMFDDELEQMQEELDDGEGTIQQGTKDRADSGVA